jgi:hypothetical protein
MREVADITEASWRNGTVSHPPKVYGYRCQMDFHPFSFFCVDAWTTSKTDMERNRLTHTRFMEGENFRRESVRRQNYVWL